MTENVKRKDKNGRSLPRGRYLYSEQAEELMGLEPEIYGCGPDLIDNGGCDGCDGCGGDGGGGC